MKYYEYRTYVKPSLNKSNRFWESFVTGLHKTSKNTGEMVSIIFCPILFFFCCWFCSVVACYLFAVLLVGFRFAKRRPMVLLSCVYVAGWQLQDDGWIGSILPHPDNRPADYAIRKGSSGLRGRCCGRQSDTQSGATSVVMPVSLIDLTTFQGSHSVHPLWKWRFLSSNFPIGGRCVQGSHKRNS